MSGGESAVAGRVAVVTGAASGIGRALAVAWAVRGARVAAIDRDDGGLTSLVDDGGAALALRCDVGAHDQAVETLDQVEEQLGPVDVLVNAAGVARMGRIGEASVDDVRTVMDVNYFGMVHMVDRVLPGMRSRGRGRIINFASIAGWLPGPGGSSYVASKFAVVGYSECLAMEVATTPIRVLCVCPPPVDTPMLDEIRTSGNLPARADRFMKAIGPGDVVAAVDRAMGRRQLFVFPGRGTSTMIRARRFAPALMTRMLHAVYGPE